MKEYAVIITPAAEEDLQEIFTYISIELSTPETAVNLCNRTEQAIMRLNTLPDRHTLYKKEPWFSKGLRYFPVGNFLIFYIVQDSENAVHILRIMYSGRDVKEQL